MTSTTQTDMSVGVGLVFSLIAIGGAIAMTVFGYTYAINHAAGEAAHATQINAGLGFGLAMLAAGVAITAIHVYGN